MDDARAIFVEGMGAAAATSGILTQLEGRIFALLYLQEEPLALEDVAAELGQSKSNISVNIRGLVDWHLVRRVRVPGSRKDHYEAATNLWRVMQEIMERRFRWNLRQVLAAAAETARAAGEERGPRRTERAFIERRLEALRTFVAAVDAGIGAFAQGKSFAPETMQNVFRLARPRAGEKSCPPKGSA
jgi:HTH-type transcriptional regulator, glycine betaine synthesis regulator